MNMSSTQFNVGIDGESKSSSRILKPPGGGHSNIFAPPDEVVRPPRPKNDQQNSSMMCEIMGKKAAPAPEKKYNSEPAPYAPQNNIVSSAESPQESAPRHIVESQCKIMQDASKPAPVETKTDSCPVRTKVPPGGFSSGFW